MHWLALVAVFSQIDIVPNVSLCCQCYSIHLICYAWTYRFDHVCHLSTIKPCLTQNMKNCFGICGAWINSIKCWFPRFAFLTGTGKGIRDDKEVLSQVRKKKHSIPAPSWLVGIPIGSATRYVTQQPGFVHYPSHLSTDSSQVPPATPLRHGPLDYNIQRPVKKVMLQRGVEIMSGLFSQVRQDSNAFLRHILGIS